MSDVVRQVQERLPPLACATRAAAMSAYMRGQFTFLGVQTVARRQATGTLLRGFAADPVRAAQALWALPAREYQYVGADLLRRQQERLSAADLPALEELVLRKSWWDTVDSLAVTIGGLLLREPTYRARLDEMIASPHLWLRRVALLHQLAYKERTDSARLFAYCLRCAPEKEFFIRKAIGWALRQYARTVPAAVGRFLEVHRDELSGLSYREAARSLPRPPVVRTR